MQNNKLINQLKDRIEQDLFRVIDQLNNPADQELYRMVAYHLGWEEVQGIKPFTGKRIRPLFMLLTNMSCNGNAIDILPAATAVELLHNFSLIHDDIQDNSLTRRGFPTVWNIWGIPQAINTGDTVFALALSALTDLYKRIRPNTVHEIFRVFISTCIELTQGQHHDLAYESRQDITLEEYWSMIHRKTAALLITSIEIGALSANADKETVNKLREFGKSLGLAFQVKDDILGIWGEQETTGKSSRSDLVSGKITLPVIYGLSLNKDFAKRWRKGEISTSEAERLANILEKEGARRYADDQVQLLINQAHEALKSLNLNNDAGEALFEMSDYLLHRRK